MEDLKTKSEAGGWGGESFKSIILVLICFDTFFARKRSCFRDELRKLSYAKNTTHGYPSLKANVCPVTQMSPSRRKTLRLRITRQSTAGLDALHLFYLLAAPSPQTHLNHSYVYLSKHILAVRHLKEDNDLPQFVVMKKVTVFLFLQLYVTSSLSWSFLILGNTTLSRIV